MLVKPAVQVGDEGDAVDAGRVGDLADDLLGVEVDDDDAGAPRDVEPPVRGVHFEEVPAPLAADLDLVDLLVAGRGVLCPGLRDQHEEQGGEDGQRDPDHGANSLAVRRIALRTPREMSRSRTIARPWRTRRREAVGHHIVLVGRRRWPRMSPLYRFFIRRSRLPPQHPAERGCRGGRRARVQKLSPRRGRVPRFSNGRPDGVGDAAAGHWGLCARASGGDHRDPRPIEPGAALGMLVRVVGDPRGCTEGDSRSDSPLRVDRGLELGPGTS